MLERGLAVGSKVDDKAANLVTFNAVVLGLLATGFTVAAPLQVPPWALVALCLGPLLLVASMLCALHSYRPTEYAVGLAAADLTMASSLAASEGRVLQAALRAYGNGIGQNQAHLAAKSLWVRRSLGLLAAGLGLTISSTAFIIPFLAWGRP